MIPFVIDLDDHEGSGIRDFTRYHANGEREEVMSAVLDGEGVHGHYNITDTVMCKMPTGVTVEEALKMNHVHVNGFETFFVDSGSMYLVVDGYRTVIHEGDIVHLQAGQTHGMASIEDVKWRGFFHDLDSFNDAIEVNEVLSRLGIDMMDPDFSKAKGPRDFIRMEPPVCTDIPVEQMAAVKHPSRPHSTYKFDGVTVKLIVPRWENAGVSEVILAEMDAGTAIHWGYHRNREQYYVRKGKVKLSIFGEEHIAGKACVINVPKLAPFSLTALEDAEVYDMGGQTRWSAFLQDYLSIQVNDPARLQDQEAMAALKEKFGVEVREIVKG